MSSGDGEIDEWVERTAAMVGEPIDEREAWNTRASVDQARHFNNGLGTVNPRYSIDGDGAEVYPTYLVSVKYPLLHGAMDIDVPMSNVIGFIEYEWDEPITIGMDLEGTTVLEDVTDREVDGRRQIDLLTEVPYTADGAPVARARSRMTYISHPGSAHVESGDDRGVYAYSDEERGEIEAVYEAELERVAEGPDTPRFDELAVADPLPTIVRGPLTIGDIAAWYAGGGIPFGASIIRYRTTRDHPQTRTLNPETNWVEHRTHQHLDPLLTEERGMALPFASGVQTYSWTTLLVTNWMGRRGFLKRHREEVLHPHYYSDTLWLRGQVGDLSTTDAGPTVGIDWSATTQLGTEVARGRSVVLLPDSSAS